MAGPRKWELFPAIETAVADHRAVDAHHPPFPVFVATVDNPAYRARYAKTACHLQSQGFTPFPVQMLDAEKDSGSRRKVVYQGWQRVLVPYLMACVDLESGEAAGNRSTKHTAGFSRAMSEKSNFLVVMEDDVRVTVHASELWIEVETAMKAYPFMDVLSLGHHWQPSKRAASRKAVKSASRESGAADALLTHLQHQRGSCGIHACTLLALRCGSVERLRDALEKGKATHFDQWLFLQQQSVCVFFREPALAGWMDCDITLNPPGKLRKKANHRGEDEGSVPFHDNRHAGTCLGRRGWVPCADVGTTPVLNVRKGKGFVGWNPATTEGTDQRHC